MRHIHKINSEPYTVVVASEPLEQHITIVKFPNEYAISEAELPEGYQRLNFSIYVPQLVSLASFQCVMQFHELTQSIEAALNQLPEPNKTMALIYWNKGNFVERTSTTVAYIQSVLGKSDEEVDQYFIEADAIQL